MPTPTLSTTRRSATELEVDVLVVGVRSTDAGPVVDADGLEEIGQQASAIGFTGGRDEFRRIPAAGVAAGSVGLVGLGSGTTDAAALRYAAGTAVRNLNGARSVGICLPAADDDQIAAVLEGAGLGSYSYTAYRSAEPDPSKAPVAEITVCVGDGAGAHLVGRADAVVDAVGVVRDLVNAPPSDLYPATLAQRAVDLAAGLPVEVEVLGAEELAAGGYGGIIGVGQGSPRGPRLVKVSYSPAGASRHIALVGKGITFDTGGISLKPPASMVGMKYDMTGSATVLAVVLAAARTGIPIRLTAWMCLAENMPSGSAIRPNDVLRVRGGTTVEVLNTDAEGRLVMADGLVAACEEFPDAVIDVATLTGAATVAMGTRYVAAMGDERLVSSVVEAAGRVGEPFWPMPLPPEMRALLDSDVADIANAKIGSTAGGMLLAGVFLKEFVGRSRDGESRIPWAHLDIAGSAHNSAGAYGFTGKGPTGVAVRALFDFVESAARETPTWSVVG